ncbi:hypothetical protein C0989_001574 [Termitomyces sp. Mn162]|nr:hypothetical protein C0989_001574 [Termitomyces sp. Mn162]
MATTSYKIGSSYVPTQITDVLLGGLLFIEFIDVGDLATTGDPARDATRTLQSYKRKNHAVIRVPFLNTLSSGERESTKPFFGVLISMEVASASIDSNKGYYEHDITKGDLRLKLIRYEGPTFNTMHTFSVNLAANLTVGHLISILQHYRLEKFKFTMIGITFVGCRDFV